MPALWKIRPGDLRHLQGMSPPFTEFLNELLRSSARSSGVADDKLRTTIRDMVKDGGIDAAVDASIPGDATGWLGHPTAWQYKSRAYVNEFGTGLPAHKKALSKAINKPAANALVKKGYAYRLAICDGIPASTKDDFERVLKAEAAKINPKAPAPKVLTEDDLAEWANRFPSICIRFFKNHLQGLFQTFTYWQSDARALVPDFVEVLAWRDRMTGLADFADLAKLPASPVVTVQGEAGVGKTRLVCEAMGQIGNATSLLLYTKEERSAVELARHIAVQADCTAILIADECGLHSRVDIENVLTPHKHRVRAICIDNSAQRPATPGPEVLVKRPPEPVIDAILERNFPGIPAERRRSFAALSGGFIRLAVDLCSRNEQILADGDPSQVMTYFQDHYLARRLSPEQLRAVQILSLLTKVGFKADIQTEVHQLSEVCGLKGQDVLDAAVSMKDAPGFVAFAGRFLYVTPAIIARAAFLSGWRSYIDHDVGGFLGKLPGLFIERLMERVEQCGTVEMRQEVSAFFGDWTSQLTQQDLADEDKVRRLVQLVEIQPERFLPVLRGLVMETPLDRIRQMHASTGLGSGPRRQIVWFCERAAIFPECFAAIEEILFRLSLAESEPNLGNNATNIWIGLFQVYLSGTALPFADRFSVLRKRALSDDKSTVDLAIKGLAQVIHYQGLSRITVPPVVMGRVPPEQWRPSTAAERKSCLKQVVDFMVEVSGAEHALLVAGVREVALSGLRRLLVWGFLKQVQEILNPLTLPPELRPRLRESLDHFFEHDADSGRMEETYLAAVRMWAESLQPSDFFGRMVMLVGLDPWHHRGRGQEEEERWKSSLKELARECVADSRLLDQHHQWLHSEHARSAFVFGETIGKQDEDASLLKTLSGYATVTGNSRLATGYVQGLLRSHPSEAEAVNAVLDEVSQTKPSVAFELMSVGGDDIQVFDRVTELVENASLGAECLGVFERGVGQRSLTGVELCRLLDLLNAAINHGNKHAARVGIRLLRTPLVSPSMRPDFAILGQPGVAEMVYRFLEYATPHVAGDAPYWRDVLKALLPLNAGLVIDLAVRTLISDDHGASEEAQEVLVPAAEHHAAAILSHLTPLVRDKKTNWRFRIFTFRNLVRSLPVEAVNAWLDETGVDGALALARSLSAPFMSGDGTPTVPQLTLTVLRRFGDNARVFTEFCLGIHSFQAYWGDIADEHEREACVAERFLDHEMAVVRKWAQAEIETARWEAKQARQEEEEFEIS